MAAIEIKWVSPICVEISLKGKDVNCFVQPVLWCIDKYAFSANCKSFKICAYKAICKFTLETLVSHWIPQKTNKNGKKPPAFKIQEWLKGKLGRKYGKKLHEAYNNLVSTVPEEIRLIDKKLFSAFAKPGYNPLICNVLEDTYLKKDVLNIRAAAVAIEILDEMRINTYCCRSNIDEKVKNWRTVFGKPSTSLNKTLAKLPGSIPVRLLIRFNTFSLPRPVFKRSELIFLLLSSIAYPDRIAYPDNNLGIQSYIAKSVTHNEIKKALELLGKHNREKYSIRKTEDINTLYGFCRDYPGVFHGKLVGLTEKSIEWHRDLARNRQLNYNKNVDPAAKTIEPHYMGKICLPDHENVRFLDSAQAVMDEGALMGHCIGGYASGAIKGNYYLFHVDYEGEMASVQISRDLHIVQNHGPHNRNNKAVEWARRYFNKWRNSIVKKDENDESVCSFSNIECNIEPQYAELPF